MRKMILSAAFVIAATAALAQAPADTVRVRGTVQSVDGSMLTVKSRDGADLKIKLADKGEFTKLMDSAAYAKFVESL